MIFIEFEQAAIKAFSHYYQQAAIKDCFFHFSQVTFELKSILKINLIFFQHFLNII
jgi:hypothetical protein